MIYRVPNVISGIINSITVNYISLRMGFSGEEKVRADVLKKSYAFYNLHFKGVAFICQKEDLITVIYHEERKMKSFQKKSTKYLLATVLVYALLVAPHEGEFWPFSIYPMFSQAGNPWTRALVRDVTSTPDSLKWQTTGLKDLNGSPAALREFGVDQIDFANYISKTKTWTPKRKQALQVMFGKENIKDREFMIMKVQGRLIGDDSVTVKATPLLLLTAESVISDSTLAENETITVQ